jgi:hypothetical protein
MKANKYFIFIIFSLIIVGCRNNPKGMTAITKTDVNSSNKNLVECRLFWIADNYYEDNKLRSAQTENRRIMLGLTIFNRTNKTVYIPFKSTVYNGIDSINYRSSINLYVKGKIVSRWLDIRVNFIKRELKPADSTYIIVRFYGTEFKKAGVNEKIPLKKLMALTSLKYKKCLSDTVFSKYPISDIVFTKTKYPKIRYRQTTDTEEM